MAADANRFGAASGNLKHAAGADPQAAAGDQGPTGDQHVASGPADTDLQRRAFAFFASKERQSAACDLQVATGQAVCAAVLFSATDHQHVLDVEAAAGLVDRARPFSANHVAISAARFCIGVRATGHIERRALVHDDHPCGAIVRAFHHDVADHVAYHVLTRSRTRIPVGRDVELAPSGRPHPVVAERRGGKQKSRGGDRDQTAAGECHTSDLKDLVGGGFQRVSRLSAAPIIQFNVI